MLNKVITVLNNLIQYIGFCLLRINCHCVLAFMQENGALSDEIVRTETKLQRAKAERK